MLGFSPTSEIDSLYMAFEIAGTQNNHGDIQRIAKKAEEALSESSTLSDQLKARLIAVQFSLYNEKIKQAGEQLSDCFTIWRNNHPDVDDDLVVQLYLKKALYQRFQSNPDLEEVYLDSARQILIRLPNPQLAELANVYRKLCYLSYNQGKVIKSIAYMEQAETVLSKSENLSTLDSLQLANIYNDIAYLKGSTSNYDDVIPFYRLALKYNPTSLNIKLNMISNLRSEGDHKSAYAYAKEVLAEARDDQADMKALALISLIAIVATSENYLSKDPKSEIEGYFQRILDLEAALIGSNYPHAAGAAGTLCDYHRRVSKKKDLDRASQYLSKQEELIEGRNFRNTSTYLSFAINLQSRKAQLAWRKGNYAEAEDYFKVIWKNYSDSEKPSDDEFTNIIYQKFEIVDYLIDYSKMYANKAFQSTQLEQNDLEKANRYYRILDHAIDSLLTPGKTKINNATIEELHELGFGIAIIQHQKTNDFKDAELAYQRFEKLSSLVSFRHHIQSKLKHSNATDEKLIDEKNLLREQLDILEGSSSNDAEKNNKIDSLDNLFMELSNQLAETPISFNAEKYKNGKASLKSVQSNLNPDDLLLHLAYDNISDHLYILAVSKDQVKTKLQLAPDLRYNLEILLNKLADPNSTGYEGILKDFYHLIIEPFQDLIENKRLIFIPSSDLAQLPFDLLMNQNNNFLCFENSILNKYSSSWNAKKSEKEKFKTHLLALTNSNITYRQSETRSEGTPMQLVAASKEIEALKGKYGATLIKDEDQAKVKFIEQCKNAGIIHLAVHSDVQALNPIKSRLLFSKTGNIEEDLYYHEIDDLNLSSDLVILSSCQSGLGYPKNAGSVSSLARAFQFAGANNLVQTLWSINDESTAQFMDIFYTQLESKKNLSSCLATSKKMFFDQAPTKWKHPYYWGAFVLNGEDGPVDIYPTSLFTQYKPFFYFSFFGLVSLLLYFRSRKNRK